LKRNHTAESAKHAKKEQWDFSAFPAAFAVNCYSEVISHLKG
jgi:uncharacterized membrane protein YjjB (DUF3815 family)